MTSWNLEQVEENKYAYTFDGVRNVILCSLSRFEEFNRLANELTCLLHYKVVAAPFCPHNKVYVSDNEAYTTIYEVENE